MHGLVKSTSTSPVLMWSIPMHKSREVVAFSLWSRAALSSKLLVRSRDIMSSVGTPTVQLMFDVSLGNRIAENDRLQPSVFGFNHYRVDLAHPMQEDVTFGVSPLHPPQQH
eukprot:2452102-Amphidinium_carterae.1